MSQFNYRHPTEPKRLCFGFDRPLQQYFYDVWGPDPDDPPEDPTDSSDWVVIDAAGLMNGGCDRNTLLNIMVAFGVSPILLREVALDLPMGHVLGDFFTAYGHIINQGHCVPLAWSEDANPSGLDARPLQEQLSPDDKVRLHLWSDPRGDVPREEEVTCSVLDVHTEEEEGCNTPWLTNDTILVEILDAKNGEDHGYRPGDEVIVHRQQIWKVES